MKYFVFVDESGTHSKKNIHKGVFEIIFLFVPEDKKFYFQRYFERTIYKFRSKEKIDLNEEIKGYFLMKIKKLCFVDKVFSKTLERMNVVSTYIDFKKVNEYQDINSRFFHMIKLAIERAKDQKFIKENDILEIIADVRKQNIVLKEQLIKVVKNEMKINIDHFEFVNSKTNIMIQIADIISFKIHRLLKYCVEIKDDNESQKCVKNIRTGWWKKLSIREVYYKKNPKKW